MTMISAKPKNPYLQMQRFAEVTKQFIITGNIQRAKKCLLIAESIFTKGNTEIKNVVANVYVFSVTSFMELHHCSIRNLLPESLKSEYNKQINTSGV